ncbi:MAG: metallophosphoesterase [Oscillospiraceae bacterium]|jgi:3',5'-cyclic AMP phosphodiesterase CpdA|nr:metallophosphoesterase [Oscillospiraceae bacterium]
MLKFHLVTDTHYYNYEKHGFSNHLDQVTVNESGAIIDAIFDKLLADASTDLVLIAGDLVTGGDRVSHEAFLQKLRRLQLGGKRVFVITASHDYKCEAYGGVPRNAEHICRAELFDFYYEFGFRQAIARYAPDPLSYVAQLAPGYRVLCLNGDLHRQEADDGHYLWAAEQIAKAKAEGQMMFGMHHYPVLPPSPIYPILAPNDGLHADVAAFLANAGLRFVFTGHTHMQNIARMATPEGGLLYDINTGAAVGCGAPFRTVVIDDETMRVTTETIHDFDWDLRGKSVKQYLDDNFDKMLRSIFEAADKDVEEMLDILDSEFRVNKAALLKFKPLLVLFGKFLYRLTFGGAARLLCCKIPPEMRHVRVKDFIMEAVRSIYAGDEPYSRTTPQGAAAWAITGRLDALAKPLLKKADLPFENLQSFVASLLYDSGLPDNNAVLPLK